MMDELTDDQKCEVYQFLYRHSGLTHDQVWEVIQNYGYRKAFKKVANAYKIREDFDEVING